MMGKRHILRVIRPFHINCHELAKEHIWAMQGTHTSEHMHKKMYFEPFDALESTVHSWDNYRMTESRSLFLLYRMPRFIVFTVCDYVFCLWAISIWNRSASNFYMDQIYNQRLNRSTVDIESILLEASRKTDERFPILITLTLANIHRPNWEPQ